MDNKKLAISINDIKTVRHELEKIYELLQGLEIGLRLTEGRLREVQEIEK